jgi:CRISPR-associated protein Cmr3
MNPRTLLLQPVDAWFFRDGRPYNKQESNQMDVESVFPPPPSTVVGSIRAALARGKGWNGAGAWGEPLAKVLGNGFDDLGQLSFSGPWLVRQGNGKLETLFPAPLHLLGRPEKELKGNESSWTPAALLVPGSEVDCDIGKVRLPVPNLGGQPGLKDAAGLWITGDGLKQVLQGQLPQETQVVSARQLWRHEYRIGLVRREGTRTTDEQALYSPRYVRLCRGISLAMEVRGLPNGWEIPGMFPLGGEGRLATCGAASLPALPPPPVDAIRQSNPVTVTLLTPLAMPLKGNCGVPPMTGQEFPGLPGARIVSACVERPQRLGGWDSLEHRPLPLTPLFPPGSTWFCTVEPQSVERLLALHGKNIGTRTSYGFGQIVLGTWNDIGGAA